MKGATEILLMLVDSLPTAQEAARCVSAAGAHEAVA
jgi:hypothetical protein